MAWVELQLGQKVKMMTLQSNSHRSIETLVTSVTWVYQIEVDPSDASFYSWNRKCRDLSRYKKNDLMAAINSLNRLICYK